MGRGDQTNESFGLRHVLPSGLVSEVSQEDIRAGRGSGTSGTDDPGNRRGVRYRDTGDGADGGTCPSVGLVSAEPIDWGGRADHKKLERPRAVPRVPGFEKEAVGRGGMGRRVFCPDGRRPDDSGRYHSVYSTPSRSRARACAAGFEAALLMPRGLPRGLFTRARHGHRYRGESPLQVHMAETASRTARASIARWGLKEAAGKATIRGTRTAREAGERR